jgi:hypothetical protein
MFKHKTQIPSKNLLISFILVFQLILLFQIFTNFTDSSGTIFLVFIWYQMFYLFAERHEMLILAFYAALCLVANVIFHLSTFSFSYELIYGYFVFFMLTSEKEKARITYIFWLYVSLFVFSLFTAHLLSIVLCADPMIFSKENDLSVISCLVDIFGLFSSSSSECVGSSLFDKLHQTADNVLELSRKGLNTSDKIESIDYGRLKLTLQNMTVLGMAGYGLGKISYAYPKPGIYIAGTKNVFTGIIVSSLATQIGLFIEPHLISKQVINDLSNPDLGIEPSKTPSSREILDSAPHFKSVNPTFPELPQPSIPSIPSPNEPNVSEEIILGIEIVKAPKIVPVPETILAPNSKGS